MNKLLYTTVTILSFFLLSCDSNNLTEDFRLDKKYWTLKDYDNAVTRIQYANIKEKKPSYSNPEKRLIIIKLVDTNNIYVVVQDTELGTKYKSDYTSKMFRHYQNLSNIYSSIDREDNFLYPEELVDLSTFGLYLQLQYFELGNQVIIQQSDNPNSSVVQSQLNGNIQSLIRNFSIYLNLIKQEHSLNEPALEKYVKGINLYFPLIVRKYPKRNFREMEVKAKNMLTKAKSNKIKIALEDLIALIQESK